MHPDLTTAVGRAYQQEMRAQAHAARRAAELEKSDRSPLGFSLPRIEFRRRVGAVRIRIAHA